MCALCAGSIKDNGRAFDFANFDLLIFKSVTFKGKIFRPLAAEIFQRNLLLFMKLREAEVSCKELCETLN